MSTATRSSPRCWRATPRGRAGRVEAALEAGVPIPDIYLEVLEPALREVGHRWAMGALNVAEEHYATAVAQSILDGLSRRLTRAPKDGRLAVVSGTPEELHAVGMRMVADFLEADGWEVLLLGPGAPAHDIAALVESEQPDLVALSTATAGVLNGVVEIFRVAVGARAAPVHRRRRAVLDRRDERDRARVRRRPRHPGPARARRGPASADPAARTVGMRIREGGPEDAAAVLALFDEAVAWLVARGQTGQWGSTPFSQIDARVARGGRVGGERRVADRDARATRPVGALVLGARPEHVSPAPAPERYITALVTSRAHAGQEIGAELVHRAIKETRTAGVQLLRVDCWAGAPALVAWYERQGFAPQRDLHRARAGTGRSSRWSCPRTALLRSSRWCSHRIPVWKSRNVLAASVLMPVRPATRDSSWLSSGSGPGCGVLSCPCCPPEHGYRPFDTRGTIRNSVRTGA